MVRNQNQLARVILNRLFGREEPRLNLSKRDEIVWLVEEDRIASIHQKIEDHVEHDQTSLSFREFRD
jgi:hypothetical protein